MPKQILVTHRLQPGWKIWPIVALVLLAILSVCGPILLRSTSLPNVEDLYRSGDCAWLLLSTALVLLMTPGLAFFYGGMVQQSNIVSSMMQCLIMIGVVTVLWVLIGFSLAFGEDVGRFIGKPSTFWLFRNVATDRTAVTPKIPVVLYAVFQLKFAIITPALVTGAFVERLPFLACILFGVTFHLAVYCPIAHWVWHPEGFLSQMGVLDFAGGAVVHISAGFAALGSLYVVPARRSQRSDPANLGFVILGTGLLWFGWFGFNAGSAVAADGRAVNAFATTNTSAASAMIAWMALEHATRGWPSTLGACIGCVVGLVAVTPCAGFVSVGESIAVGTLSATACYGVAIFVRKFEVDDTLDVFACHGIGGALGMLLCGFFAKDVGVTSGLGRTFLYQCVAILVVGAWSFTVSYLCFKLIGLVVPLRVKSLEEDLGMDTLFHGEMIGGGEIASLDPEVEQQEYRKTPNESPTYTVISIR